MGRDATTAIEQAILSNDDEAFERAVAAMSPFEVKNLLVSLAKEGDRDSTRTLLNAGRGNPNWVCTLPREAFFLLGEFALAEARRTMSQPDYHLAGMPCAAGSGARLEAFLAAHDGEAARFLKDACNLLVSRGLAPDKVAQEWSQGILGCEYPVPERILPVCERAVGDYLTRAICDGDAPAAPWDLFATEGGTAAMCYLFYSLKSNFLLEEGDTVALMCPIFTPYLEIPHLNDYGLKVVDINASARDAAGLHTWQYPDEELQKLADPKVKLLCLVNPSNPPSVAMDEASRQRLVAIVREKNPDLMIVTDDVYGTFVPHYRTLMADLPENTACVYSFSKYFGATGWRLAVTAVAPDNVFDRAIAALPADRAAVLAGRYSSLADDVSKVRFVDRMVADSRLVALNGTAGLGTPQQVQMSLFALFGLLDAQGTYRTKMRELILDRLAALWKSLGFTLEDDPLRAGYYSVIDLGLWAERLHGPAFRAWLTDRYDSLDMVVRLAKDTGVVLMDGHGFDAPEWSVRVSLANLDLEDYVVIGGRIAAMLGDYADAWRTEVAAGGQR